MDTVPRGFVGRKSLLERGLRSMCTKDEKKRCRWVNLENSRYVRYHDEEWGVLVTDERRFFEMLLLECFQAGLSWECVLNKREAFAAAFDGFDAEKICAYGEEKFAELLEDSGIIRNRLKIRAAVSNASVFRAIQREWGSFSEYLRHWSGGMVIYETGKTTSGLSDAISKDVRRRGMKFVGSVIVYSYLQAVGVVNSHEPGCFLYHGEKR